MGYLHESCYGEIKLLLANKRSFCFLGIALFLSCSSVFGADSLSANKPEFTTLTTRQLIQKAAAFQIIINDWRDKPDGEKFIVDLSKLSDQKAWFEYLQKHLSNWAITHVSQKKIMFLLPVGLDNKGFEEAVQFSSDSSIDNAFEKLSSAKEIKNKSLMQLPEIIALKHLSEFTKNKEIVYQRLINPESFGGGYSFKVKYHPDLNMMLPYEKNGQTEQKGMEGFSSFYSSFKFISANIKNLKAYRSGEWLYLKHKDDKYSTMGLCGTSNNLQIATKVNAPNIPRLDVYLTGNKNGFKSIGNFYHSKGVVTLVDVAIIN